MFGRKQNALLFCCIPLSPSELLKDCSSSSDTSFQPLQLFGHVFCHPLDTLKNMEDY